jgi:hypothetical protein
VLLPAYHPCHVAALLPRGGSRRCGGLEPPYLYAGYGILQQFLTMNEEEEDEKKEKEEEEKRSEEKEEEETKPS